MLSYFFFFTVMLFQNHDFLSNLLNTKIYILRNACFFVWWNGSQSELFSYSKPYFVFLRRKQAILVYNNTRVSNWWQKFHFWTNYTIKGFSFTKFDFFMHMQMAPVFLHKGEKIELPLLNSLAKHICLNNKFNNSGTFTSHDPHTNTSRYSSIWSCCCLVNWRFCGHHFLWGANSSENLSCFALTVCIKIMDLMSYTNICTCIAYEMWQISH